MRFLPLMTIPALLLASAAPALASPHVRRGPTAPRLHLFRNRGSRNVHASLARTPIAAPHYGMSSERATEIQTALIKSGYMTGTPSGSWDATSQAAMEKLQSDSGWQTKIVPDSRALIKLGLGPNSSAPSAQSHASTDSAISFSGDTFPRTVANQ